MYCNGPSSLDLPNLDTKHAVVPEDKLRFALTARYIKPEYIDDKDRHKGIFRLTPEQIYDGQ